MLPTRVIFARCESTATVGAPRYPAFRDTTMAGTSFQFRTNGVNDSAPWSIRAASMADLAEIHRLMEPAMSDHQLLPRDEHELARLIPQGFVAESDGRIVGFAAIEVYSRKLAEIQGLVVADGFQHRGIGRTLVRYCIERARELNVYELMAITSSEDLFRVCGFDYALPNQKRALFLHPQEMGDH